MDVLAQAPGVKAYSALSSGNNMAHTRSRLNCERVGKSAYGKWKWDPWTGSSTGIWTGHNWGEFALPPNNTFPDIEQVADPICREYARCDWFFRGKEKDPLLEYSCENVNDLNENCDRVNFNCREGLKPTVDYVTCKRKPETMRTVISHLKSHQDQPKPADYNGAWEFPENVKTQEVKCQKVHD